MAICMLLYNHIMCTVYSMNIKLHVWIYPLSYIESVAIHQDLFFLILENQIIFSHTNKLEGGGGGVREESRIIVL